MNLWFLLGPYMSTVGMALQDSLEIENHQHFRPVTVEQHLLALDASRSKQRAAAQRLTAAETY